MTSDLHYLGLVDIGQQIQQKKLSSVEVVRAMLGRIEQLDGKLKSYAHLMADSALAEAATAEKEIAAGKAIEYIRAGMTVGLGTGSTAYWAIQGIGDMVKDGLSIKAVATSVQSEALAKERNIPIIPFSEVDQLDVTIDGADEVDKDLNLIKGGGGALLREKIVAAVTKFYIIIVQYLQLKIIHFLT